MVELLQRANAADARSWTTADRPACSRWCWCGPPAGHSVRATRERADRCAGGGGPLPGHAPNQLTLSEALLVNGEKPASKAAARRGLALAQEAAARGEPDASGWIRDGETLISGKAPR